jgi:hypothetical protein
MPDKAKVRAALEPYQARIRGVVEKAWAEYQSVTKWRTDNGFAPLLYSRTISNDIFDGIARYAIAEFAGDPTIHVEIEAQTVKFFFKGGVLGRFKKGGDDKLGQNIPTQAVMSFIDADELDFGVPLETTAKVEFIWIANDINTKLDTVLVVARDGDTLLWEYEIEAAEGATVIPFPSPKPTTPEADDDTFVTPKKPAKNDDAEEA